MSMLSSMTEQLRTMSEYMFRQGNMSLGCQLRDAAETIDNLRCSCNDLQFENEKLKQLIRDYNRVPCLCDHNGVRCEYDDGETCELYERGIALGALRAGVD